MLCYVCVHVEKEDIGTCTRGRRVSRYVSLSSSTSIIKKCDFRIINIISKISTGDNSTHWHCPVIWSQLRFPPATPRGLHLHSCYIQHSVGHIMGVLSIDSHVLKWSISHLINASELKVSSKISLSFSQTVIWSMYLTTNQRVISICLRFTPITAVSFHTRRTNTLSSQDMTQAKWAITRCSDRIDTISWK